MKGTSRPSSQLSGVFSIYTLCALSTGNGGQSDQSRESRGGQTEGQVSKPGSQTRGLRPAEEETSEGGTSQICSWPATHLNKP